MGSTFWGELGLVELGRILELICFLFQKRNVIFPFLPSFSTSTVAHYFQIVVSGRKLFRKTVSLTPKDVCHPGDLYKSRFKKKKKIIVFLFAFIGFYMHFVYFFFPDESKASSVFQPCQVFFNIIFLPIY